MFRYFLNLKIQKKLLLSSLCSVVLILFVGGLSYWNTSVMRSAIQQLSEQDVTKATYHGSMNDLYWMRRLRGLFYLFASAPSHRPEYLQIIRDSDRELDEIMARYQPLLGGPEEKNAFKNLQDYIARDRRDLTTLLALEDAGKHAEALAWNENHSIPLASESDSVFDPLKEAFVKDIQQREIKIKQQDTLFSWLFFGVNFLVIGFMIGFALWFSRFLGIPLNRVSQMGREIAAGNLTVPPVIINTNDEIGELSRTLATMQQELGELIRKAKQNSTSLSSAAEEMSAMSTQLADTSSQLTEASHEASEQTAQIDNGIKTVAAAAEQSSANIRQVYRNCGTLENDSRAVGEAASTLTVKMQSISESAEEMSSSVNTVASAVEQLMASLNEVAHNASNAAGITSQAAQSTEGTRIIIEKMEESGQKIGQVVDLIKSIASQTNLLALNATIEAASAGEAGKGFAVVANEVKELARQSAAATEDIRRCIEDIQQHTHESVNAINATSHIIGQINDINSTIAAAVEEQAATVQEVGKSISGAAHAAISVSNDVRASVGIAQDLQDKADESIGSVSDITSNLAELEQGSSEIAQSAQRVAGNATEVAHSSEQVRRSASDTAQGAQGLNSAAVELSELAGQLDKMLSKFTVEEGGQNFSHALTKAISAHSAWKKRLKAALETGTLDASPEKVRADNQCEFGQWLYNQQFNADDPHFLTYKEVKELHRQFHESVYQVLSALKAGDQQTACRCMDNEFAHTSSKLVMEITNWRSRLS